MMMLIEYNTSFPERKEDLNLESEQGSPYIQRKHNEEPIKTDMSFIS